MLCQAKVLEACGYPAARALFFNLLRYLDGPGWRRELREIAYTGNLNAAHLAKLTGLPETTFKPVPDEETFPGLVLAGDGAETGPLLRLAEAGATVLVLSTETCSRLPGYEVEQDPEGVYSATRRGICDHPIFHGVAGPSFLPLQQTPARGAIRAFPKEADILLSGHCRGHSPFVNDWTVDIGFYGLETREPAPPIAVGQRIGKGQLLATTLEPFSTNSETHRQLLVNLLANAGAPVPNMFGCRTSVTVKQTPSLQWDGKIDDWINDMEDINLSEYAHADPIPLGSSDRVTAVPVNDPDLSGLLYLLHDREHLYLGGVLFSASDTPRAVFELDGKKVAVDPAAGTLTLDGEPVEEGRIAVGTQKAGEIPDIRLLKLTAIHKQIHKPEALTETPGTTFEAAIPWGVLACDEPPATLAARFEINRGDTAILRVPAPDEPRVTLLFQND